MGSWSLVFGLLVLGLDHFGPKTKAPKPKANGLTLSFHPEISAKHRAHREE